MDKKKVLIITQEMQPYLNGTDIGNGHVSRGNGLVKIIMQGTIPGGRRPGRPRQVGWITSMIGPV